MRTWTWWHIASLGREPYTAGVNALPRCWLFALAATLGACASAPPPPVVHAATPVAPELTLARDLLASLPAGADGCVVAWPGRLSERRRHLLARVSAARGFPFLVPEGPTVYAEAWRYRPDGGVSSAMTWEFAGSRARLRRFIERRAPLATRFDGPDEGDTSAYAARFVGPHRVLLTRGEWPPMEPSTPVVGVEGACAHALDRAVAQGAYELGVEAEAVARARPPGWDSGVAPNRVTTRLLPARNAVRAYRQETYDDAGALEAAQEPALDPGRSPLDEVLLPARSWRVGPRRLRRLRRVRFEDLALLDQDDAERRRVMLADQRARSPLPVERVHVEDRGALEQQLTLRRVQLELVPPAGRDAQRAQLLELLRRGREAHPSDVTLVLPYARMALELNHDYEAALEALDALPTGVVDARELDPLRREALSYASEERLADALVEDLAVPARVARQAAHDLVAARRAGTAYEAGEGLWLAQHALAASSLRASGRAPRGLSWPVASLPEAAAALIDQAGLERPLYVVARASELRGDAGSLPEALGRYATLHLSDASAGAWVLGATTRGELSLARLGALLDSHVSSGELDLMVAIVGFGQDGGQPEAWLHLVGRVRAGRVEVTRLSLGGAPEVEWSRVAPLLADPLATAGTRVFPAPTLDLAIEDPEQALSVAESLSSVASCTHTPAGLACRPRTDRGAISRALGILCRSAIP